MLDLTAVSKLIEQAGPDESEQLYAALSTLQAQAMAKMLRMRYRSGPKAQLDLWSKLLTAVEAARLTGLTPRWFYERAKTLPFARRPSPRRLRFDEAGLMKWFQEKRVG